MVMEFLWEFLTYKNFDKFQRRRCNQNSLNIRWQWNSYGNSSRILIRILCNLISIRCLEILWKISILKSLLNEDRNKQVGLSAKLLAYLLSKSIIEQGGIFRLLRETRILIRILFGNTADCRIIMEFFNNFDKNTGGKI